jgi:hypothetical protein
MSNDDRSSTSDDFSDTLTTKINNKELWENSNTEKLLKEWGEKAAGLRWMHRYSASYWRGVDKRLNLLGISLSSFISASSLIGAVEDIVPTTMVMTAVGFVGMLNILNQSLMRFYNSNEKITLHETAAKGFGNIHRLIATKLSLAIQDRGNPKKLLKYVLKENERLFNDNIEPHSTSINAFLETFDTLDVVVDFTFPDIVGKSFKIHVFEKQETHLLFEKYKKNNKEDDHYNNPNELTLNMVV